MPKFLLCPALIVSIFFLSLKISAQTELNPGDLMVLAISTEMSPCGLSAGADQISFVSFKDIENGTTIDITDNGWEVQFAGYWGDSEGTLRMTRTGGTIPRGTVMTFQGRIVGGVWTYRMISPDAQWTFTDLNVPGGPFNMDNGLLPLGNNLGGDQIYFMQGGDWDNQGGGGNRATYDGRLIWAHNTNTIWVADGTVNSSNLHPDVTPCYYSQPSNPPWFMDNSAYTGPTSGTYWDGDSEEELDHFGYLYTVSSPQHWGAWSNCSTMNAEGPNYVGATIEIVDNMGINCYFCGNGCAPYDQLAGWTLPQDGAYNVTYYVGNQVFTLNNVVHGQQLWIPITEDVEVGIISIEKVGGCTLYSNFFDPFVVNAVHYNAGVFTELWVCSNHVGQLDLDLYLQGDPDPGGLWIGPGYNLTNGIWIAGFGPNDYVYTIVHPHGSVCVPPWDSATFSVHTVDPYLESEIEVSCDQNGTPNDIFDDVTIITLNIVADGMGPDYYVTVSGGTITPQFGLAGIPQVFTLWPGSAMGPNVTLTVRNLNPEHIPGWICNWPFDIEMPGFCSDPCDYTMASDIQLQGIEEICVGNCPDDPATFTVEVEGGTEPYKMDLSISAPNFPVWNLTSIPIESFNEIEICVQNVPAPVYNANANLLTLPTSLAGSYVSLVLANVYDKYDCTSLLDNDVINLSILALPTINPLSLVFCSEDAKSVDLTEYEDDLNLFYDIVWYDGNPLTVGDQINFPNSANLNNVVELWAYVEDDFCENSRQVGLTVHPSPELDSIADLEICTGTAVALQSITIEDLNNSMATYTFHSNSPLNATTLLDPGYFLPADSTTVYVLATALICYDSIPIDINVQDFPDFLLQANPCDLINNTYSILFTTSADSIHASVGTVINNPTGQDQITGIPNNVNVSVELLNSTGLCKDTFLVTAPNCNCPFIAQPLATQPVYSICEGTSIPVLSVTVNSGMVANWYNLPVGGTLLLQNSLTYQPPSATSANYYVEALDPLLGCYSVRTEVQFIVNPVADLQAVADQVLCETETINLNSLSPAVLNGVGGGGSWFNLSNNQPASGNVQPQQGDAWYYLFNSNPGNCPSADTFNATVNQLPDLDLFEINCDENTLTFELLFTTDATNVTVSAGNLVNIAGTDSFSLESIPFDTDIQFDLVNSATGCAISFNQQAPDCSCPALLQQTDHEECSDQGNIDLSAFIGFGVTGNWQLLSAPAGSNPATLAGNNFQGQNKDAGNYSLRFIRSVILDNCVDTALFQITLHDSPFADAGVDRTVCAPDNIILSGSASGSNLQFSWQENGTGSLTNPGSLNPVYTPTLADITAGSVSFTLTATDQTGFCPSAQETIDITIDGSAYYILDQATQSYCDTSDITVDFDDLITFGTTGGVWFFPDTVSAPINANSQFNPSTLQAGNYTVFYTSTNAVAPCKNDTAGVNLIIENCLCPSVALSVPIDALCSESGNQDLNDFLLTTESGTWSIVGTPAGTDPAVLNGSDFITNTSDDGIYRLRFTLNNPVSGCDEFAEISLEVIQTPTIQVASVECADDLQSWEAIIVSSADDVVNTLGTITSLGNDRYLVENITINTSLSITASNNNGQCSASINVPAPDCACTLSISSLPDDVILCPDDKILFEPDVTGGKGAVTVFWIVGNDSLYQNTYQATQAGVYQFVSFDELGCREEHTINVSFYEEMVGNLSATDISCPGHRDGTITLHAIQGGNGPFSISINDGAQQPVNSFPHVISGLAAGNYKIELFDGFNCTVSENVPVDAASSENVNLGPDQTILVGDSILISPLVTFTPDTFYWTGDLDIIDVDQLNNWISPESDKSLILYAIDEKGCLYSDDIFIRVLLSSSIYVPNIFSPNGDGNNDVIAPLSDPSIVSIEYFEIYSRWGELVFSAHNFAPNQGGFGWNGLLMDKPMSPGVFVYRLSATNKKGKVYTQYGDLTLVR